MRRLFRWAFRLVLLVVILLVALVVFMDSIVRALAEREIRSATGMDVKIGSFSIGLVSPVITIENFKLYNTAEFGGSPFVDLPELRVEYSLRALCSRKLHCKLVRFNLAELNVVQNKDGKTNLQALQDRQDSASPSARKQPKPRLDFTGIDVLNLSFGRATLLNMNDPQAVRQVDVSLRHKIIRDIKNGDELWFKVSMALAQNGGSEVLKIISPKSNTTPKTARLESDK
jgi:uncharacterized protein involved in outer membrane biogenesis